MLDERSNKSFWTLRMVYGLLPIAAGVDKFANLLTDWTKYLSADVAAMLPVSPQTFMYLVGVIEIVAGLIVLSRLVRFGAYLVSAWLCAIAVNLMIAGFIDVAVRDLAMAAGAFALAKLAEARSPVAVERTVRVPTHAEPLGSH